MLLSVPNTNVGKNMMHSPRAKGRSSGKTSTGSARANDCHTRYAMFTECTGIPCTLADDPDCCVAYGCGKSLAWINHMTEGPINIARKRILRG